MKCQYCHKELPSTAESKRPFCNDDCLNAYLSYSSRKNKTCEICGNPLVGYQKVYCSPECAKQARKAGKYEDKDKYKKPKAEPKKKGRPKKVPSIAEVNARAKALGLSYGQYVGRCGL